MSETDDSSIRKARADAIRHARDKRNASLAGDNADESGTDEATSPAEPSGVDAPNYVEFVDRKMRERKKSDDST